MAKMSHTVFLLFGAVIKADESRFPVSRYLTPPQNKYRLNHYFE